MSAGSLGNGAFFLENSVVDISGGSVGDDFTITGHSLVRISGGTFGNFLTATGGSIVSITGGKFGNRLTATNDAVVNISDAVVGDRLTATNGAVVNVTEAVTGNRLTVGNDAEANIFSGRIGNQLSAQSGGTLNIFGGVIGEALLAAEDSVVNLYGGSFGDGFDGADGPDVNIYGDEFRLNNVPIEGLADVGDSIAFDLPEDFVLSGIFADGTPFVFASGDSDQLNDSALTLTVADLAPKGPGLIKIPDDPAPLGIRNRQTLLLNEGGDLGDNFTAGRGSTVVVDGGTVGNNLEAVGAEVSINGGLIGFGLDAYAGSIVNISGGTIAGPMTIAHESVINVASGAIAGTLLIEGGTANITGGAISELRASGSDSIVNLTGKSFVINDHPIPGLVVGEPLTIDATNGLLSAILTDSSLLNLELNRVSLGATLTITLLASTVPGDYNQDGVVNAADYIVWRNQEGTDFDLPNRDPNLSGNIGPADYDYWAANFGRTAAVSENAVPEPATACLLALSVLAPTFPRRRHRSPLSRAV